MAMMDHQKPSPLGMSRIPAGGPVGSGPDRFVPTQKELDKIQNAIHDPTFRAMLVDYAKQMNDPNNRRTYETEMVALEAQRGVKCTFLHPRPGYVIKTRCVSSHPGKEEVKAFINVCFDENVGQPTQAVSPPTPTNQQQHPRQRKGVERKRSGQCWSLPYFQSQPHSEKDSSSKECNVYDVIFNPLAEAKASEDPRFKRLLDDTSLDAVEKAFDVKLDRAALKFPKMKFKGTFRPTVIREPINPSTASNQNEAPSEKNQEQKTNSNLFVTPQYVVKYKTLHTDLPQSSSTKQVSDPCRPTHLVVEICLTGLASAKAVDLDVTERGLTLECAEHVEPRYRLEIDLSYPVLEHEGVAKFDKSTGCLAVTLPVQPAPMPPPVSRLVSTDSGIGFEEEEEVERREKSKPAEKVEKKSKQRQSNSQSKSESNQANKEKDAGKLRKGDAEVTSTLPPYTCNIYEDLMVFKLDVKNVNPDSLTKEALTLKDEDSNCHGFALNFENVGAGMVAFRYSFQMALVSDGPETNITDILERAEIEVWDNNVIVQLAIPQSLKKCKTYRVGATTESMTEHPLPQLKEFRMKKDQLQNKSGNDSAGALGGGLKDVVNIDGKSSAGSASGSAGSLGGQSDCDYDDSADEDGEEKERHTSGESVDSALSFSLSSSINSAGDSGTGGVQQGPSRGILKYPGKRCVRRCFSESHTANMLMQEAWNNSGVIDAISESISEEDEEKRSQDGSASSGSTTTKTVRFDAVVKRQVFRQNASILGQKTKNMKKAEQKARREAKRTRSMGSIDGWAARRASEGDAALLTADGFKISSSFESNLTKPAPPPASNLKQDKKVGKSKPTEGDAGCSSTEVKVEAVPEAASEDGHDSGVASSYEDHHHQTQTNKAKNSGKGGNSGGQASKKQLDGGEKGAKSSHGGKKGKSKQQLKPRQAAAVTANDFIFDLDE